MTPTISYIQSCFDEYNARFFSSALPPIPIKLSHAKGFLGKVTFTRRKPSLSAWLFGSETSYKNENFVLRINVRIDLPEELIQDTILHEMIHYYIAVNQLRDTSTHGRLFRQHMARINAGGNRHITISHRLTDDQRSQAIIHKTRAVALVRFSDGQTGIKVVPNNPQHIRYWEKTAKRRFPVSSIEWHFSSDDYFARFPSSVAMKVYLIANPSEIPL